VAFGQYFLFGGKIGGKGAPSIFFLSFPFCNLFFLGGGWNQRGWGWFFSKPGKHFLGGGNGGWGGAGGPLRGGGGPRFTPTHNWCNFAKKKKKGKAAEKKTNVFWGARGNKPKQKKTTHPGLGGGFLGFFGETFFPQPLPILGIFFGRRGASLS